MTTSIDVEGTPYYLASGAGGRALSKAIQDLTDRVEMLRGRGKLSPDTLRDYYGEKRFEQIAESNGIEGSPLTVGETELAVMKGITISGHDPGYSRDAQTLAKALDELAMLAKQPGTTDGLQVKRIHDLILGERAGAGVYRQQPVRISGSSHRPPESVTKILDQMDHWERWSASNGSSPAFLRSIVLHAWLTHIHPFIDGNGRTARAIGNLELIRAGYPAVIIRRKDRDPYLDALRRADEGDLGAFVELLSGRLDDALRDLERSATRKQGYDARQEKVRKVQQNRLAIWSAAVHLLCERLRSFLDEVEPDATVDIREYDQLSLDDFIDLSEGRSVSNSWAFIVRCRRPGVPPVELLAWAGTTGDVLKGALAKLGKNDGRPALNWSDRNPEKYPPWRRLPRGGPGGDQFTLAGDQWLVARDRNVAELPPARLGECIAADIASLLVPPETL